MLVSTLLEAVALAETFYPSEVIEAFPYNDRSPNFENVLFSMLNAVQNFLRVGEIVSSIFAAKYDAENRRKVDGFLKKIGMVVLQGFQLHRFLRSACLPLFQSKLHRL